MLKDIRLHIEQDEEKQSEIEATLAADIKRIHARNIQAFSYHIPSLLELVQHVQTSNAALICNKFGEKNIVDYGNGRTLYGLNPIQEIDKQYQEFCRFPQNVQLVADSIAEQDEDSDQDESSKNNKLGLSKSANYQEYLSRTSLPKNIEVLVVLGIGLGRHIQSLIANHNIRHLVVYEPEVQYFQCSVMAIEWESILDQAKAKQTAIYLQVNKDGRDITADLSELNQHFPFEQFYLYQHYHHPIFDSVAASLRDHTWQYCVNNGIRVKQQSAANYIPIWTQSIELDTVEDVEPSEASFFKTNIAAFKKYYPAIAKEFEQYQSKTWNTVLHADKQINLIENNTLACWHGDDPKTEGEQNFANFSRYPNKDGLVLGYKGTKLKHYLHYQFVAETEKILEELEEEAGQLPEEIKSLIVFGIGTGYQLDSLFANHSVENLFICEPNRDFFYASLHAIDWAKYLKQIDDSGARLYLNIGDDGTHLFRDLLNQFYSIGPYILANTYFYQSYYNSNLVAAVAQLREQLQVVISMGEYYDHARYGIAHTTETISRGYPFLIKDAAKKLSYQDKEVPIFLVGNGPSLDKSIETIKEWKEQAIVISCGTALMPLYKNGIVPDFHAEIEQNRSTFDWICRIGDFDYLKQISLISCNGIHPDTCDLFKDVYLAFKEGESSTASAIEVIGKGIYEELQFAFPTVANFALNIFTKMGFNQVYLFGVDLGFLDPNNHHSKDSGYYQHDGSEMYDYRVKNNIAMQVAGNYRKIVYTKHEFKVSKAILEQLLRLRKIDCFNCSDGAKIETTTSLQLDNVLLSNHSSEKLAVTHKIKTVSFVNDLTPSCYIQRFEAKYQPAALNMELNVFINTNQRSFVSIDDVYSLIEEQKKLLFASYQHGASLLFYLLYGTVNYVNALLSKIASASQGIEQAEIIRKKWLEVLLSIQKDVTSLFSIYDVSVSFAPHREDLFLKQRKSKCEFSVENKTEIEYEYYQQYLSNFFQLGITQHTKRLFYPDTPSVETLNHIFANNVSSLVILTDVTQLDFDLLKLITSTCVLISAEPFASASDWNAFVDGFRPLVHRRRNPTINKIIYSLEAYCVVVPKLKFVESDERRKVDFLTLIVNELAWVSTFIDFHDYIAVPRDVDNLKNINLVDASGTRGRVVQRNIVEKDLLLADYSKAQALKLVNLYEYKV